MKKAGFYLAISQIVLMSLAPVAFAHEWMAPEALAQINNPLMYDQETIARGRALYQQNRNHCHGDTLEGLSAEQTGLPSITPNLKIRLKTHSEG